jgi:hypothetical protein
MRKLDKQVVREIVKTSSEMGGEDLTDWDAIDYFIIEGGAYIGVGQDGEPTEFQFAIVATPIRSKK